MGGIQNIFKISENIFYKVKKLLYNIYVNKKNLFIVFVFFEKI